MHGWVQRMTPINLPMDWNSNKVYNVSAMGSAGEVTGDGYWVQIQFHRVIRIGLAGGNGLRQCKYG